MHLFTYWYKGKEHSSVAIVYTNSGVRNYRVTIDHEIWITIAPSVYPGIIGSILWVQLIRLGEAHQPNELVQAFGKGIEAAGI